MDTNNLWILGCPAPTCGELANGFYNVGPMLADDREGITKEDSKMQIFYNVTESDFDNYIDSLRNIGINSRKL